MRHPRLWLFAALAVVAFPALASAQGSEEVVAAPVDDELAEPDAPDLSAPPTAQAPAQAVDDETEPAALESIVRGLYLEARVGGGYALASADIPADPVFPALQGQSEELGAGSQMGFHFGYDVTDALALELVTGATFISGRRDDRVRDVGLIYGGLGARFSFELERRLNLTLSGAATFVQADNGVEDPESGPGILAGAGLEYYVHVRHFSVGVDVTALAPLSPTRVFVGITPKLKYTF
ncbi:MAG: adventurous gliding motility protein CglE [Myxococcota bacterium]